MTMLVTRVGEITRQTLISIFTTTVLTTGAGVALVVSAGVGTDGIDGTTGAGEATVVTAGAGTDGIDGTTGAGEAVSDGEVSVMLGAHLTDMEIEDSTEIEVLLTIQADVVTMQIEIL